MSDHPLGPVPQAERRSFLANLWVLLGFTFFSATMWTGGSVGASFPDPLSLTLVVVLGNLILGVYAALLAVVSQRSGLSTVLQLRRCLGLRGNRLAEAILGLTQVGWYAWGTATVALLVSRHFELGQPYEALLMVTFGLLFCFTSFLGFSGLKWLSLLSVPLLTLFIGLCVVQALGDYSSRQVLEGGAGAAGAGPTLTWTQALTLIVGTYVSGGTQVGNWTRFARTPSHALWASLAAFFVGNGLMIGAGAICGLVYRRSDFVEIMAMQGLVGTGVGLLLLNLWTTQNNTIYSFAIAGCSFLNTTRRKLVTLVGSVVGIALALAGIYEWLVPYLLLMGTYIPPLGGIILADQLLARRRGPTPELKGIRWAGVGAYAVGALAAAFLPGIPTINGMLAALVAYVLLGSVKSQEVPAVVKQSPNP
jgi:cytosine permease